MTSHKNQNEELDLTIARLEHEREVRLEELKNQLSTTFDSLNPIHLIKDTFEDIKNKPEVRSNLFQTAVSLVGGYMSKKILIGKPKSLFKTIMGFALQYGMTKFIAKKTNPNA